MFRGEDRFSPNYYTGGQIIGLLLDLSIRHDTDNARSLDDVMRSLYWDYYKHGKGFTTEDLKTVISRVSGRDYQDFFRRYLRGTELLSSEAVLAYAGLRLVEMKTDIPRLGLATQESGNVVTTIVPGAAAQAAGIEVGDLLLGSGNIPTSNDDWVGDFRKEYRDRIGQVATAYVLRGGKPMTLNLKITSGTSSTWNLEPIPNPSAMQRRIFDSWSSVSSMSAQ